MEKKTAGCPCLRWDQVYNCPHPCGFLRKRGRRVPVAGGLLVLCHVARVSQGKYKGQSLPGERLGYARQVRSREAGSRGCRAASVIIPRASFAVCAAANASKCRGFTDWGLVHAHHVRYVSSRRWHRKRYHALFLPEVSMPFRQDVCGGVLRL